MRLNLLPTSVVEEMAKSLNNKSDINCQFYETSEDVPDPRDWSRDKKNLMISIICNKKSKTNANRII